jgi:hypothetical protein
MAGMRSRRAERAACIDVLMSERKKKFVAVPAVTVLADTY